jgi:hypothetical protein
LKDFQNFRFFGKFGIAFLIFGQNLDFRTEEVFELENRCGMSAILAGVEPCKAMN